MQAGLINIFAKNIFIFSEKALKCFGQKLAGGWGGNGPEEGEQGECTKEDRINRGWPCYTDERPIVYCGGTYNNDNKADTRKISECVAREGHKKTHFVFAPSADKSIRGGHKPPANRMYWMASCFGIGTPCSSKCEGIFK